MKIKTLLVSAILIAGFQSKLLAEKGINNGDPIVIVENDPETIIANYIKAVGGEAKVKAIKNASMTAEANFQGQIIEIKTIADSENTRMMQSTAVGGNVMQKTLLVGGQAQMVMMGQVQELPEETAAMLKPQTYVFPEQFYDEMGFELEFLGTEEVDGQQANKIGITAPNGMVTNEFYSVESGLKLKTSSDATGEISYSDYQAVDGVLFPMMLTIKNPMLPVALEAKMISVKFNQTLSDSDFQ
ncbi:MAG: peptidase, M16 family protein [Algoriphagus sp.]|uniref:peptidase, M16 family protein n=1 Tax=Algoriphagus sp. TaxID=1872435 RepID=UPI002731EF6E|nr:peptidase, M16 family protein [Algoriphagus sp.]MDP2040922.1 peptidase, M16 family protein [Algoriphagus sp.]MDP3470797.1 peptidase, M16 family protein [Algoriphagus sp.]